MSPQHSRASSGLRIECPHADRCGGCPLISLPYDEQLARKSRLVASAVSQYPELAPLVILSALAADPITGYRTRAKLMVAPGGRIGLYGKGGGHEVVDIPGCRVLSPALALVADALRARLKSDEATGGALAPRNGRRHVGGSAAAWSTLGGGGALRALDLREIESPDDTESSGSKVLVTLVIERSSKSANVGLESLREAAHRLAEETPSVVGVAVNFHDGASPRVLGPETVRVFGGVGAKQLGAATSQAPFGAFTQAHRGQAERVHELVAAALLGTPPQKGPLRVVDIYGGSGAIALALASRGAVVTLVESFEPAVLEAKEAASKAGLALETFALDAESALSSFMRRGRSFDAAVVNPPRRGMNPATRQALGRLAPAVLAYVSCDPVTLARDLAHLARLGFLGSELQPLDMIPLTRHVETLAVLRRGEPPLPLCLFEDDEVLAVSKAPHEPTTPQGEHESSLLDRVRRMPSAGSAVPIHRLDVGTSGAVFFARAPAAVHRWSQALGAASAEKVYLALVRGVTPDAGTVARPLHEARRTVEATTHFRRVASLRAHSLLEVRPEQGRTHQIRRHLAAIGHPVLGDVRYGHAASNRYFEEKYGLDRTFLHCARISLPHPRSGEPLTVEAPLAADLEAILARLRETMESTENEETAFG
jgi:23S rRNA (uracil1939-C5)-methyltransferase